MDTTEKFAEKVKKVGAYFKEITPTKEIEEPVTYEEEWLDIDYQDWKPEVICCVDHSKEVRGDLHCPIDSTAFINAFWEFKNELDKNVLANSDRFIAGWLKSRFKILNSNILPTIEQLFDKQLVDEVKVLETYEYSIWLIKELQNDVDSFCGTYCSIYREQLQKELNNKADDKVVKPNPIILPLTLLQKLQNTICSNKKPFLRIVPEQLPMWQQTKQLARELLTHPKVRGDLAIVEMERQAPSIFIYHKDCKPLELAKNKPISDNDSDLLQEILATFQVVDS